MTVLGGDAQKTDSLKLDDVQIEIRLKQQI